SQSVPQSMPAGSLVTFPAAAPPTLTATAYVTSVPGSGSQVENVAVTSVSAVISTTHVASVEPSQAPPLQVTVSAAPDGVAVSVTSWLAARSADACPSAVSMPAGLDVSVPSPSTVTLSVKP